ncbi:recombination regulator RecX [Candidatus Puniceispirillum sp.]|nr:recombination regulator RecX [Candidatus Puniceispirillum sp.]
MTKSPAETRLMNKALDYLGRYATSKQRLSEVLGRFAMQKLDSHGTDEVAAAISMIVTRCQTLGYLNDEAFAQSQARIHRRQGRSKHGIRQRLRQHRLDDALIEAALDAADQHAANGELLAACLFAKRRRIGPFYRGHYDTVDDSQALMQHQQRQLAKMARAGFAMKVGRTVLELEDIDAVEQLIDKLEQGEDPTM